jgi:Zn-dependent protease with chaperone function
MTPEASFSRARRKLAPISSLDELLVLPVPISEPVKRSIWTDCLNDLTFLLPTFGIVFGLLLLWQSPFLGAAAVTLCPIILAVRIRLALKSRRERRQVSELVNWHQRNRLENLHRQRRLAEELPDVMYCPIPPVK